MSSPQMRSLKAFKALAHQTLVATPRRGTLIVIEGVDRSGKSTQAASLVARLNALSGAVTAVSMRFPDRTTQTGKLIDAYLTQKDGTDGDSIDDRTIHLLFAANRAEAMVQLRKTLMAGTSVVVDRYAFSGVAYTHAKGAAGLDVEWCMAVDAGIIRPDVVFFLDIPTDVAASRGEFGQERYERQDFQEKVRSAFLDIADKAYWKILDARQSKDALGEEMLHLAVTEILKTENKPLQPLWQ
ncbi:Thymidylate kinase [Chytriomyces hyalinus]|nr:Thymidylate kinase [Chytriomyces hyalinus]